MDKQIQLIWDYLDNNLSVEDRVLFESRLSSDENFIKAYKAQLSLHEALLKLPVEKAPEDLLLNIMDQLSFQKSFVRNYSSFSGLKNIFLVIGIITFGLIISTLIMGSTTVSEVPDYLSYFADLNFNLDLTGISLLPYSLVLVCAVFLIWMDNLIKTKLTYAHNQH